MRIREVGELGLVRRVRGAVAADAAGVRTGIGDDTAVLTPTPGASLLATTDLLVEDVHFRRATASPRDIGWKAIAVNVSDIAAMGGIPRWALVGLAVADDTDLDDVDALYAGMLEAAAPHGVVIVGGDTTGSPGPLMIDVTVLGEHGGTPRLRSMARAGDVVAVTGTLGRSAAGLRLLEAGARGTMHDAGVPDESARELTTAHRRPAPRVAEGRWLAAQPAVHAMMDCSDGLATDLGHVCRESDVGARIELGRLPVGTAARQAARALGVDPLAWAVSGGEDYELLVTIEAEQAARVCQGLLAATGTPLTVIGEITAGAPPPAFVDARGGPVEVAPGYEHFRTGSSGGG